MILPSTPAEVVAVVACLRTGGAGAGRVFPREVPMSRIAQDALAALFLSLDDERRALVQRLTRLVLELSLTDDEREQYVAGFILHAVDAQNREHVVGGRARILPLGTPRNDVVGEPEEPLRMTTDEVVRELVRPSRPPSFPPPRKASGQN